MLLADSSVWIDYFRGRQTGETDYLDGALRTRPVLMGDLILTEVLQGFRSDQDFQAARDELLTLPFVVLGGRDLALASAQNYRRLRQNGVTVRKTIDMVIATYCIMEGHTLLHTDRDFDVIETYLGLKTFRSAAG